MAHFKMAEQYPTIEATAELPTSDSKKRPLDGAGEGRPSFKRSNLGGKNNWVNLLYRMWKIMPFISRSLVMEYIRRHIGGFTLWHLSLNFVALLVRKADQASDDVRLRSAIASRLSKLA